MKQLLMLGEKPGGFKQDMTVHDHDELEITDEMSRFRKWWHL